MNWLNIIRANLGFKTVPIKEFREVQKGARVEQPISQSHWIRARRGKIHQNQATQNPSPNPSMFILRDFF
jgi:hypothetical protein